MALKLKTWVWQKQLNGKIQKREQRNLFFFFEKFFKKVLTNVLPCVIIIIERGEKNPKERGNQYDTLRKELQRKT